MRTDTALLLLSLSCSVLVPGESASGGENDATRSAAAERVVTKEIPDVLVAGRRMKGQHSDMDKGFQKLGRSVGRYLDGKPLALFYNPWYRESEADFEPCFPVKKKVSADGIACRTIKGGSAVTLIHRGSYEAITNSYAIVVEYCKIHKLKTSLPTREVYLKGPGRFFKGNPKKYITEIQFFIGSTTSGE